MDSKVYLRIIGNNFGFIFEGRQKVEETDIPVTLEDYNKFYVLQVTKRFRLKETPTGTTLFDYLEEYTPEIPPVPPTEMELLKVEALEQSEYMVEMDYRLMNLELGL